MKFKMVSPSIGPFKASKKGDLTLYGKISAWEVSAIGFYSYLAVKI